MFNQNEKILKFFEWFSYGLVLLTILAVPLLIDRNLLSAYIIPKQYVFIGLLLVNLLFFATKTILSKKISFRQSVLDVPLVILLALALVSSLFSVNIYDSFLGRSEYFVLNFVFLFFLVVFYFVLINVLRTPERWRGVLDAVLGIGGLVSLLFILRTIFGVDSGFLSGIWNVVDGTNSSFGLWVIPVFIISAGSLIKKNTTIGRALFYLLVMILSLEALFIMGFGFFWWVLLVGLALLLLLGVSFLQDARMGWLSVLFVLLIMSCAFIIFGSPKSLQSAIPAEVSLDSVQSWSITKQVLFSGAKNFLVGSGLGTFAADFSQFRSAEFNMHPTAWSLRFTQPVNSLMALLSESGVLVTLGFIFIILFVLGHVFSTWFKARGSAFGITQSLNLSKSNLRLDVFLAVVAWVVLCVGLISNFYSVSLWVMWWLLLGVIISGLSLLGHNVVKEKYLTLEDTPQYNLAFSFGVIVAMALIVMTGILGSRFYVAERVFARSLQESDYTTMEADLQKAISLRRSVDIYHTAVARAYLVRASELAKVSDPNVQEVTDLLARAVSESLAATKISPNAVAIRENLATMYENAALLVPEATDWAVKSLDEASKLEPTNPILVWRLGNNYMLQNNPGKAIEYYQKAINLKQDYVGAYISLSTAYETNKDTDKAIDVYANLIKAGLQNNSEVLFNLGRLLYNRGTKDDKNDAEQLWLEAIKFQPEYSNALYSLGLLYENKNDKNKALEYYYKVKELNPGNKDIVEKIKTLVAGAEGN